MISLNKWLEEKYIKPLCIGRSEAIVKMSADVGASYSTLYRWLNDGDYFISNGVSGTPWESTDRAVVLKAVRFI